MKQFFDIYNDAEYPIVRLFDLEDNTQGLITHAKDLSPNMVDNGTSQITFTIEDSIEEPQIHYYDDIVMKNRIHIEELDMIFVITECPETTNGIVKRKEVTAISLETEDFNKPVTIQAGIYSFHNPLKQEESMMHIIMRQIPEWTIGDIDVGLGIATYRFEDETVVAHQLMLNEVEDKFQCVFKFDTVNKKVHAKLNGNHGKHSNIVFKMSNVVQEVTKTPDNAKFTTAFEVMGSNLSVATVNPLGGNTIYNFNGVLHRMSEQLRNKVTTWQNKVDLKQQPYADKLRQLNDRYGEKQTLETELKTIQNNKDAKWSAMSLHVDNGSTDSQPYRDLAREYNLLQEDELAKKKQIKNKQTEIDAIMAALKLINDELSLTNNFTAQEIIVLSRYTYIAQVVDENFIGDSSMSNKELQDNAQRLYDKYKKLLAKQSGELVAIDVTMDNFIQDADMYEYTKRLELGDFVTIDMGDDKYATSRLLVCEWNYDDRKSMTIQLADGLKPIGDKHEIAEKKIHKQAIDNSLKADMAGWKEASSNNTFLNNMQNEGLNANLTAIKSNDNEEFKIDGTGAVMRKYLPETDTYSPEQLWLAHNQIVLTDNAWETLKTAIGKILYSDGTTWGWGINAELLVSKLILSQKCIIQSEDTMITLDKNGINVENGNIFIKDKNGNSYIDGEKIVLGNGKVGMSTNSTLPIGQNVMIFAGATSYELREDGKFLVYDDGRVVAKDFYAEGDFITPYAGLCSHGTSDDSVRIYAGANETSRDTAPFRVTQKGDMHAANAYIKGEVECTKLKLNGQDILVNNASQIDSKYIANLEVGSIKVDTARVDTMWSKNLFVENFSSGFTKLLYKDGATTTSEIVDFIRIKDARQEWVTLEVNPSEYEYMTVNNGQNVYYVYLIDDNNSDRRLEWFTFSSMYERLVDWQPKTFYAKHTVVTNGVNFKYIAVDNMPVDIETWEGLTGEWALPVTADQFKVKAKKKIKEAVKKSILFGEILSDDGTSVISPVTIDGEGVRKDSDRGKAKSYKNKNRWCQTLNAQDNDGFGGIGIDAITSEPIYYNPIIKKWLPLVNIYNTGDGALQTGNVIIHPVGSTIDTIQPHGSPCLHVVHDGTVLKDWGATKLMQHLAILGEEVAFEKSPIKPLPPSYTWIEDFNDTNNLTKMFYITVKNSCLIGSSSTSHGLCVLNTPLKIFSWRNLHIKDVTLTTLSSGGLYIPTSVTLIGSKNIASCVLLETYTTNTSIKVTLKYPLSSEAAVFNLSLSPNQSVNFDFSFEYLIDLDIIRLSMYNDNYNYTKDVPVNKKTLFGAEEDYIFDFRYISIGTKINSIGIE